MGKILSFSLVAMLAIPALAEAAPPAEIVAPSAIEAQQPVRPALKRKVAIGRFSNETRYGKALLMEGDRDPLAGQAFDMLSARLVESGKFLVFERGRDVDDGVSSKVNVGVDALIIGSVTEFGRKVEAKSGFLNSKTRQLASATVEVRLVDPSTSQAFFSTKGSGSASVEVGEVAGFGSAAGYDSTLNDQAISAAISDLLTNVMNKLQERRWFTDVLQVRSGQVFISGGPAQGLKVGDRLRVETRGEVVISGQTGLPISLPGQTIGSIEVLSFFGDDQSSQGAVARVVQGTIPAADLKTLVVVEDR